MHLVFLFLYFLIPNSNGQQCLSLANSTVCPAFKNYYVSIGQASFATYPWLVNITSIAEFDLGLLSYINSSTPWQPLGCIGHIYPRFAATITCSTIVLDYASSLPCNLENNVLPNLLCRSTCTANIKSLSNLITTNTVTCVDDRYIQILADKQQACLATTEQSTCLDGLTNEGGCGFKDDQKSLCNYCQTVDPTLECCKGLQCKSIADSNRIRRNKLIGIIVGTVGGLGCIVLAVLAWWCFWGKKKKKSQKNTKCYTQEAYDMVPPAEPSNENDEGEHLMENWPGVPGHPGIIPAAAVLAKANPTNTAGEIEGVSKVQTYLEGFCQVIYSKEPQHEDEILINQGDIIRMYYYFDDGWALGKEKREKGSFFSFIYFSIAYTHPSPLV
ncbi:hypothetical protein CLU79DRAFT_729533 [Phycomyces nitens]|nr:hypothetical protein CLU79DRAFT_729533 [Phycomyces nitens]